MKSSGDPWMSSTTRSIGSRSKLQRVTLSCRNFGKRGSWFVRLLRSLLPFQQFVILKHCKLGAAFDMAQSSALSNATSAISNALSAVRYKGTWRDVFLRYRYLKLGVAILSSSFATSRYDPLGNLPAGQSMLSFSKAVSDILSNSVRWDIRL